MQFQTKIEGIPCICHVVTYFPYVPMAVYGSGYSDADPPEEEDIEFEILDRKGYKAPWLSKKLKPGDEQRLLEEFRAEMLGERYGYL